MLKYKSIDYRYVLNYSKSAPVNREFLFIKLIIYLELSILKSYCTDSSVSSKHN